MKNNTQLKGRITLIIFFLVMLTPFISAWFLLKKGIIQKAATNQQGEFIQPLESISQLEFKDLKSNQILKGKELAGRWLLIYHAINSSADTTSNLHQMEQIHKSLGKHQNQLQRIFLSQSLPAQNTLTLSLMNAHNQYFSHKKSSGYYVVDPHGTLVLYYPNDVKGESILNDTKKLIKNSPIRHR